MDHSRIQSLYGELHDDTDEPTDEGYLKRKCKILALIKCIQTS